MKDRLKKVLGAIGSAISRVWAMLPFSKLKGKGALKWIVAGCVLLLLCFLIIGFVIGGEPKRFDVVQRTQEHLRDKGKTRVVGAHTTVALMEVARTLLDKPGGYLSNDVLPPSVFMDNVPGWEYGVLIQVRDLTRALRNDISRSRSQSLEVAELAEADNFFSNSHTSWAFPAAETKYRGAINDLGIYLNRLSSQSETDIQFYARADNLRDWLLLVEKRLGNMSQKLAASVAQSRVNTDLSGEEAAQQSTFTSNEIQVKTPWLKIDDVFYQARGTSWALLHFFYAIELDFGSVLDKKNARNLVRQIIRELEASQRTLYSPMVLNGSGFGLFANHSLVMGSYIARANASIIELRNLLSQG